MALSTPGDTYPGQGFYPRCCVGGALCVPIFSRRGSGGEHDQCMGTVVSHDTQRQAQKVTVFDAYFFSARSRLTRLEY
jgi:hypothetical protein